MGTVVGVGGTVVAEHVAVGVARLRRGLFPLPLGLLGRRHLVDEGAVTLGVGRVLVGGQQADAMLELAKQIFK